MQRHVDYYARNDEILRLGKELGEELTDENKEHVVSLECAWGQRIHSFACHAFYCGYRAALRVIDAVGGLESMSMIDHTLLLEYRLGYIGSYEQVEREQERKKKTRRIAKGAGRNGLSLSHKLFAVILLDIESQNGTSASLPMQGSRSPLYQAQKSALPARHIVAGFLQSYKSFSTATSYSQDEFPPCSETGMHFP